MTVRRECHKLPLNTGEARPASAARSHAPHRPDKGKGCGSTRKIDAVSGSIARLAVSVRDRTSDSFETEAGVPLKKRLDGVRVTAGAGGCMVSFETVLEPCEIDVPLQSSECALVQEAAVPWNSPESTWIALGRLVGQPSE